MNTYFLNKITDYWDSNTDSIHNFAKALAKLNDSSRQAALIDIQHGVTEHVKVLSDEYLQQVAVSMIDDIYKSVSKPFILEQPLLDYIQASAGTFINLILDRGYNVRYVIDNMFAADEVQMQAPLMGFPLVFRAAGFVYVCPQEAAISLMKEDGVEPSEYFIKMPKYIAEARDVCNMLLKRCHESKYNYVFIDTDSDQHSFEYALQESKQAGVIFIFRNEAPVKGSKVEVLYPK